MSEIGQITLYSNVISFMLLLGVIALLSRFNMKDRGEKKLFLSILIILQLMCVFYVINQFIDDRVIDPGATGALLLDTVLEMLINCFAIQWFLYVDYRLFRSTHHIKRNALFFSAIFIVLMLLNIINIFTGFMFYYRDDLSYVETPFYIVSDLFRLSYFILTIVIIVIYRKSDERLRFFSVRSFFVPMFFYVLLYYFTPMNTVSLGLSIGITLVYVQMVNEQCYLDNETGFYNRMYLDYLRERIRRGTYSLEGVMIFRLSDGDVTRSAQLITGQLPDACETIRYNRNTIITLTHINDRAPLFMVTGDVEMYLEKAGIQVDTGVDLKKKKESSGEFVDRFLRNIA